MAPPPRRLELEVGDHLERVAERLDVALADVLDEPGGHARAHPQALARLGGGLAGGERLGDLERVAQAVGDVVEQAGQALALGAELDERAHGGLLVAGHEGVAEGPDLALRGGGARLLDLGLAERGALAVLERELLELAQQPLLALADLVDEGLGAGLVELEAVLAGAGLQPARQLPRLDAALYGDRAARGLDGGAQPVGDLVAPLLAGEHRERQRLAVHALHRGGDGLDVGVLPALDAVGDHEAAAHGEAHRCQGDDDLLGRAQLALEHLHPAGSALGLRERAQLGAALGDAAVVVAEHQVDGLERGHGGRV